ncbi:C3H1-type domain-containing protein [Durusdinium trenchii]
MADLEGAMHVPGVSIWLSAALVEPPLQLLDCLDQFFRREQLSMRLSRLSAACRSCFGLDISSHGWLRLAKAAGYRTFRPPSRGRRDWLLRQQGESRKTRWTPHGDCTRRKEDLAEFVGDSVEQWPSLGVLLESARTFGPASLQPGLNERSRLAALYSILREVADLSDLGKDDEISESQDETSACEEESEVELADLELKQNGDDSGCSSEEFEGERCQIFPPPSHAVQMSKWPLPSTPLQVLKSTFAQLDHTTLRGVPVVKGKRVLKLTKPYADLRKTLLKLKNMDDEGAVEPDVARQFLQAAGYEKSLIRDWLGHDGRPVNFDLLAAMLAAAWRRATRPHAACGTCGEQSLGVQEILAGLLLAKAFSSDGQGRSHKLRRRIAGLLWRHPPLRGRLLLTSRGGSIGMGLDTTKSDHDLFLFIQDGDPSMVQELYEVLLDLQQDEKTHLRLKRAKILCKDFAVEIQGYYRSKDFDLVPFTDIQSSDTSGECQWDPVREVWQRILHKDLAPKLQDLSLQHPDGYLMTRVMKSWNESLPKIRRRKHPFISVHLPLMVLGAGDHGCFEECNSPQTYVLASLKFIGENWLRSELDPDDVTWQDVNAKPHLQRMTQKYLESVTQKELERLLQTKTRLFEEACSLRGDDRMSADGVMSLMREFFGCDLCLLRPDRKAALAKRL